MKKRKTKVVTLPLYILHVIYKIIYLSNEECNESNDSGYHYLAIPGAENLVGGRGGNHPSTLKGGGRAPPLIIVFNRLLLIIINNTYFIANDCSTLTSVNTNTDFGQAVPITIIK